MKKKIYSDEKSKTLLRSIGWQLQDRRKQLDVSAVVAAEAANISRITLHRIERGEASVAMGAYMNVILALGLNIELGLPNRKKEKQSVLSQKIQLKDYKQLKKLGWQLNNTIVLSPKEALELYERNWRHVDFKSMDAKEKKFLENLLAHFGRERLLV